MKKSLVVILALSLFAGCSGIPLASLPNLFRFQNSLLDLDPTEFMLAVQVDSKMVPSSDAVPLLQLSIQPAKAGGFEPVNKELPMRITVAASDTLGLPAPPRDRRWLIYSLAPESQIELSEIQNDFKRMQNQKSGGSLSLGINSPFSDCAWASLLISNQAKL